MDEHSIFSDTSFAAYDTTALRTVTKQATFCIFGSSEALSTLYGLLQHTIYKYELDVFDEQGTSHAWFALDLKSSYEACRMLRLRSWRVTCIWHIASSRQYDPNKELI